MDNDLPATATRISDFGQRYFRIQKQLLEELFTPEWFQKPRPRHPGYVRWAFCDRTERNLDPVPWPEARRYLMLIGRMSLDAEVFMALSGGNGIGLGDLGRYGDAGFQRFVRSRLPDHAQFENLMVELAFGAWHLLQRHEVVPFEINSFPDMRIQIPSLAYPVIVECKRVTSQSKHRIAHDIKEANRQIKAVGGPCYGIAVLDASALVHSDLARELPEMDAKVDSKAQPKGDSDTPQAICETVALVRSCMKGTKNRSVSATVVLWDDYITMGQPPDPVMVFSRRLPIVIHHAGPRYPLPEGAPIYAGLSTMVVFARPAVKINRYAFGAGFLDNRQLLGVGCDSAVDIFRQHDMYEELRLNDGRVLQIWSYCSRGGTHVDAHLACTEIRGDALDVYWALRQRFSVQDRVTALKPLELLDRVLQRVGKTLQFGTASGLLLQDALAPIASGNRVPLIIGGADGLRLFQFAIVRDTDAGLHCALAFCIDGAKYSNWL